MSSSLGRPDTLGLDEYHNRRLPEVDNSEYAIIPCMVDFGRIIRKLAIRIYHSHLPLQQKLSTALKIEIEMNDWVARLPSNIKPSLKGEHAHRGGLREPNGLGAQRLVLGIRMFPASLYQCCRAVFAHYVVGYHNVRMLLFRPFLAHSSRNRGETRISISEGVAKCVESVQETIQTIYDTFRSQTFFQTWYNSVISIRFVRVSA